MWIPHHCYNGPIFKLLPFELFCCWTIEQYFWWPVSSMPKHSVLFYFHRKKIRIIKLWASDWFKTNSTYMWQQTKLNENWLIWSRRWWRYWKETNWKTLPFYIKGNNSIQEYPMTSEEKYYVIWTFPGDQFVAQIFKCIALPLNLWILNRWKSKCGFPEYKQRRQNFFRP